MVLVAGYKRKVWSAHILHLGAVVGKKVKWVYDKKKMGESK